MGWFGKSEAVNPFSVYSVLRDLLHHMAGVRGEVRSLRKDNDALRKQLGEMLMSIDALKANVLSLINIAEAAATAASAPSVDQAAIDDLNNQVVAAINVLHPPVTAAASAANTMPPSPANPVLNPTPAPAGAPAPAPAAVAPATAAVPPAAPAVAPAVDPNAPAV